MTELTETEQEADEQAALARAAQPKPSIGRIVHYTLSDGDVDTINSHAPLINSEGRQVRNSVAAGDVYPAIIVRVWNDTGVNLQVFLDGGFAAWVTSRTLGAGAGHWAWPERV